MIIHPVGDFKTMRKALSPQLQAGVYNLVGQMQCVALHLHELPATIQNIVFELDDTTSLRFIMSGTVKQFYVMLEDGKPPA